MRAAAAALLVIATTTCAVRPEDRFRCEPDRSCLQRDEDGNPFVCWEDDRCWPRSELPDAGPPDAGDGGEEDAGPELLEPVDAGTYYGLAVLGPRCVADGSVCVENPVSAGEQLRGIDGRAWNDVWVVGTRNTVLQWNGAEWRRTMHPDGTQVHLLDVDVSDAGIYLSGEGRRLAIHDGGVGGLIGIDVLIHTSLTDFMSISPVADQIFIAGDHGDVAIAVLGQQDTRSLGGGEPLEPFLRVWADSPTTGWIVRDGGVGRLSTFPTVTATWTPYDEVFTAIDGTAPDNVYVVGDRGAVYRRGSSSWTELRPLASTPSFNAVWADTDTAWATATDAGEIYDIGLLITGTTPYPGGNSFVLRDIWGDGAGEVWAVGDRGLIVRKFGDQFVRVPGSVMPQLNAMARGPGRRFFAVGNDGIVLIRRGTTWAPLFEETPGTTYFDLHASDDGMWIAGTGLRRLSWAPDAGASLGAAALSSKSFRAITGDSVRPSFAVGLGGAFARYAPPSTWLLQPPPWLSSVDMYAAEESRDRKTVWVAGTGTVFEATDAGFVDRSYNLPDDVILEDLWAESANDVWVAGTKPAQPAASALYHYADAGWTEYDVGERVTALVGHGGKIWAAAGGRILQWNGTTWVDLGTVTGFRFGAGYGSSAGAWFVGSDGIIAKVDAGQ